MSVQAPFALDQMVSTDLLSEAVQQCLTLLGLLRWHLDVLRISGLVIHQRALPTTSAPTIGH